MVTSIRRSAVSAEPTDVITTPFTESESELVVGAGKRKRKRRRSPGGLGRGLARILTDSQSGPGGRPAADSGLLQLVGAQSNARTVKVRKFVVDTALSTLADAFALDGVVLATRPPVVGDLDQEHQTPSFLAATLPPSWSNDSQLLFEIYGNLWRVLRDHPPESANGESVNGQSATGGFANGHAGDTNADGGEPALMADGDDWHTTIGRHAVWMSRMDDGTQPVAVVAIREQPFSEPETVALSEVLGSVVLACSEDDDRLAARQIIEQGTAVSFKSEGAAVLAEVTADWPLAPSPDAIDAMARRTGVGRASDPATAAARAAAKACRPRCELTFAGASDLDDSVVSIVMIRDAEQRLRLGYAVRPTGDFSGAAEAVFAAAGATPAD